MDLTVIKRLAFEQNMGLTQVAEKCGFTPQNLRRCVRVNRIQATDLEKIANLLNVPIGVFFEEPAKTIKPAAPIEEPSQLKNLEEQLKMKDEIIDLLKFKISTLERR